MTVQLPGPRPTTTLNGQASPGCPIKNQLRAFFDEPVAGARGEFECQLAVRPGFVEFPQLSLSRQRVHELVTSGALPCRYAGRHPVLRKDLVQQYQAARAQQGRSTT